MEWKQYLHYTIVFNNILSLVQIFQVLIDENGDAEGNYTVFSLLPVQDSYSAFGESNITYDYWDSHANTTVNLSMQPVGYFTQESSSSSSTSSSGNSESNDKLETPADDIAVS